MRISQARSRRPYLLKALLACLALLLLVQAVMNSFHVGLDAEHDDLHCVECVFQAQAAQVTLDGQHLDLHIEPSFFLSKNLGFQLPHSPAVLIHIRGPPSLNRKS